MLEHDIKPEVEIFDLAMLDNAANLVKKGCSSLSRIFGSRVIPVLSFSGLPRRRR